MKNNIAKQFETARKEEVARQQWLVATKRILIAYMRAHPQKTAYGAEYFFRFAPALAIMASILLITGGITRASQGSIPGEFFYPWKVGVVETIESAFVTGAQSRADFEINRTTKRLQEITELAVRKTSKPKVVAEARQRLQHQIVVTSMIIEDVASRDTEKALNTAVKLGSALSAHQDVLTTIEAKIDIEIKPQVKDALTAIQSTATTVQSAIDALKTQNQQSWALIKPDTDINTETENKIKTAREKIELVWNKITLLSEPSDLRLEAERSLLAAQEILLRAESFLASGNYNDALFEIQRAAESISDTSALLEATSQSGDAVKEILRVSPSPAPSSSASPTAAPTSTSITTSTSTPTPKDIVKTL